MSLFDSIITTLKLEQISANRIRCEYFKVYLQFISVKTHCFHQKILSLHYQFKCSLGRCRIKKGKETHSFLTRSAFIILYYVFPL